MYKYTVLVWPLLAGLAHSVFVIAQSIVLVTLCAACCADAGLALALCVDC